MRCVHAQLLIYVNYLRKNVIFFMKNFAGFEKLPTFAVSKENDTLTRRNDIPIPYKQDGEMY